ncbi:hypothetical protein [Arthrobacter castelli]|uniref:hypothetical protein n=1 Tax=Arthrobacter castelli TaxID=271431 RepID=UPI00041C0D30|nr:hypothetical protein [Arthrobacter castelli]
MAMLTKGRTPIDTEAADETDTGTTTLADELIGTEPAVIDDGEASERTAAVTKQSWFKRRQRMKQDGGEAGTAADDTGEADTDEPEKKQGWFKRRQQMKQLEGRFESYPHLLALKPKEKYVFRSDYFEVDNSVGTVLAFFHDEAAKDAFPPFWGIGRIPDGLDDRVTAVVLEQVTRMSEKWIDQNTKQSEKLDKLDSGEQDDTGTKSSKRKAEKVSSDLEIIIDELADGASYLSVQNRLLLKAPSLEVLEASIETISRLYIERFSTLSVAAYAGEQRQELSALLKKNEKKRGKGFYFTSTELAGSHSLVTNGLNDRRGEYVGYMVGDVNNSAVLFDANNYDHHAVIADSALGDYLNGVQVADMWCSKLSQSALLSNHNVVHLVLDGADMDRLGPAFDGITSRVDLNSGDVNMFEMFGDADDELAIFSAQMEKLKLMFEQLYESIDGSVASIIRSALEDTATDFYVEQGMWSHNAKEQRHRLRVVGIPHQQVPRLQMFVSYLATAHKALVNSSKVDPDQLRAYNVLQGIANAMLSTNGDLFNNHTAPAVDGVRDAKRVVYDFSRLMRRGKGVAMAQLVNIVGFAIGKLDRGDTVIIHGAEYVDDRVKSYIETQFEHLYQRGGRVVFSYNNIDKMLDDTAFNKFDAADFTIFGPMRDKTVAEYQRQLHQQIPPDLARLITRRGENLSYLRRGVSNVVFQPDLALGINPVREDQRRAMALVVGQAEQDAQSSEPTPPANNTGAGPVDYGSPNGSTDRSMKMTRTKRKALSTDRSKTRSKATMSKREIGNRRSGR